MSDEEREQNFLDRAAYFDGRVDVLTEFYRIYNAAVVDLGPAPDPIKVAMRAPALMVELEKRFAELREETLADRAKLLRERRNLFDGGDLH